MLEKFKFATLRSLSVLSRTQVKQGNITTLRCYSVKPVAITHSESLRFLSKPIILKSNLCSSSLQLTKTIGTNLIQKRFKSTHGDHVNLWKLERIVSAAFIPLIPLCLIFENSVLDSVLAVFSVIHVHWGLEAIIIDYARPAILGPIIPKLCLISLYIMSAFILAGLVVLIYNGPGISKVIKDGWTIGKNK